MNSVCRKTLPVTMKLVALLVIMGVIALGYALQDGDKQVQSHAAFSTAFSLQNQ